MQQEGVSNPSMSAIQDSNQAAMVTPLLQEEEESRSDCSSLKNCCCNYPLSPVSSDVPGEQTITIWEEQKKHLKCIQDPSSVPLYNITGHITKGMVELPMF